jgi:cyclic dehypoxanthinyl futalosine synthase
MWNSISTLISDGQNIERHHAEWLFNNASMEQLSALATKVRARFHPANEATYLIMSIINYTNICVAKCDYCSFYRLPGQPDTYLLNFEEVCHRIDNLQSHGGVLISFNGGFHPGLRLSDYANFFKRVRARYPGLQLFELTVAEFMYYCKVSKLSYAEGAQVLRDSGTEWITGGGSEILDDSFRRRHSPLKYKVDDYYAAQRAIINAGLGTTATMVIGFDETLEERMNHLERLREFQQETTGIPSFLCWTYKPWNNSLGGGELDTQSYLRWLAICRIYLHNIPHIRTSVLTKNEGALEGLRYGANDFDFPTEDEVTEKAGASISHDFESLLEVCRAQGFTPRLREPFPCPPLRLEPVRP